MYQHSLTLWYSLAISFYCLFLVSTTNRWLNTPDANNQMVKKANSTLGLPSNNPSDMMGNNITTREAAVQLKAVEIGTMLGCTISGIYSHTIGPRENPKNNMNVNRPSNIRASLASGDVSLMKNPIVIRRQETPILKDPNCRMVFLPNLARAKPVMKQPRVCSKLMMEPTSKASSPLVAYLAILPP